VLRLIVNLPTRHLKSHLASVAFPAWCLGHRLSAQILCVIPGLYQRRLIASVARDQDLADKLSRDCRRIVASDWYRHLFPTRLSPQRQAAPNATVQVTLYGGSGTSYTNLIQTIQA
jgi:hypothetical protein